MFINGASYQSIGAPRIVRSWLIPIAAVPGHETLNEVVTDCTIILPEWFREMWLQDDPDESDDGNPSSSPDNINLKLRSLCPKSVVSGCSEVYIFRAPLAAAADTGKAGNAAKPRNRTSATSFLGASGFSIGAKTNAANDATATTASGNRGGGGRGSEFKGV